MTTQLSILKTSIRTLDNLYSLTDLHKASGGDEKHKPVLFLRLDQTKDLISEIQNDKVQICTLPVKTVRGGRNPSTYACKELVIAYAAWISPAFHLVVLRAFLNQIESKQKQIALPEPQKPKTIEIDTDVLDALLTYCKLAKQHGEQLKPAMRTLYSALGLDPYIRNNFAAQAHDLAFEFNHWINEAEKAYLSQTAPRLR
ncbi:KilA-N domain-containing protein [Gallibacterium sp. AGMB14963]|uniref:KilA-N domain-containing protein n=1 Tax=Gallibacterium faecale TaxID=3019086 RepID=UPI0022F1BF44|nr:KilA-N domain-containing protein [Gallibacterium sp. AGMB14963]MDA3979011.1 KilA-N domain-containing protein [Gallibacterium sp. AGMB14963]